MPTPTHTPASRRFLPTSSLSRSHVNPLSSVIRRPFATSLYPSSSPFVQIPYKQQQKSKDEIEVDSEDDENKHSPVYHHAKTIQRAGLSHDDTIEDIAEHDLLLSGQDLDTGDAIPRALRAACITDSSSARSDQFSSPLPKRQKRSHQIDYEEDEHDEYDEDDDHNVSSPSSNKHNGNLNHKAGIVHDEDGDLVSPTEEARKANSRFQPLPPANLQFSQTPVRTGFRSLFQNMSSNEASQLTSPLPETFSPSRKRGKREYVHGGAAEATRSWILEIANEQNRNTSGPENTIKLVSSLQDESGRFEMAEDEHSGMWMMVYHDGRPPTRVVQQKIARIRGTKTSWNVKLNKEEQLNVAVLWDQV